MTIIDHASLYLKQAAEQQVYFREAQNDDDCASSANFFHMSSLQQTVSWLTQYKK